MPDHLNIVTAQIAGYFITSVLYGLYLYTFVWCLYVLTRSRFGWKAYSDISWGLVAVTLALFINDTVNISLGMLRFIRQFALHKPPVSWVDTMKLSTVYLQTMIGGAVMIYRCFHVWGKKWVAILFPLGLWLADFGIALWTCWFEWVTHLPLTSPPLNAVACGLTLSRLGVETNINSVLGMIVYRLWNAQDGTPSYGAGSNGKPAKMTRFNSVIRIVIDSGFGYTLVSLTLFFSRVAHSNAIYITSGAEIQAVGIAFNLINIREARLRNEEQDATRITFNGNAGAAGPPRPIKFASRISDEANSASATLGRTEEKIKPIVGGDHSLA
ncbi:hypothetical protein M413DRAFT_7788 [Hebeloma cylindrosporum]|uniref:Uncharacterized protein n=1 Tax=Hebeloma cylindrosporum TaxID=76867 RepID=A0A0C3CEP0_HEBCY|nr:hypothetical protein M413DRAFT_7788 [Hebeloma cylindrosporum h7]